MLSYFLFLYLTLLISTKAEIIKFPAKNVETLIIFTKRNESSRDENMFWFIDSSLNTVPVKTKNPTYFDPLLIISYFNGLDFKSLLNASFQKNNAFNSTVAAAINSEQNNLCELIHSFISVPRNPLTKLNLVIFSPSCLESMSFKKFYEYGISQINNFTKTTTSFLITLEKSCKDNNPYLDHIINPSDEFDATKHLPLISYDINTKENIVNIFILVLQENYNHTIDFIVNYIYNSNACGPDTVYQAPHKAYYIKMRVNDHDGNKLITTIIPWINYTKYNINFKDYLKHNFDFLLYNIGERRCWKSRIIRDDILDHFQSSSIDEPYYQQTIFFSDYFPDWFDNTLLINASKQRSFDYIYFKPFFPNFEIDASKPKFYKNPQDPNIPIGFYMINSTNPEDFPLVGTCKMAIKSTEFKKIPKYITTTYSYPILDLPVPWPWYIWVIIGLILFIGGIIVLKIIHWNFTKQKDLINQIDIKLKNEEKELFRKIPEELYIDGKNVVVDYEKVLGKGASSTVYPTVVIVASFSKNIEILEFETYTAAAKVPLKFGKKEIEELIAELEAARALQSHPNICAIIGWSISMKVPCLLFEMMEMDLLSYIKSLRIDMVDSDEEVIYSSGEGYSIPDFDEEQHKIFLQILWQASNGLEYIASKNIVHKDVAARNFLLSRQGKGYVAKIADFGLCSDIDKQTNVYHASFNRRLPLKWLAIESLIDRTFSQASDVWAFGITIIEIYTCGGELYSDIAFNDLLDYLREGKRIEKPQKMPENIYEIAYSCWKENPYLRPMFSELRYKLQIILREFDPDYYYLYIEKYR